MLAFLFYGGGDHTVMCNIVELARTKQKIASLEAELAKYQFPAPPQALGVISGSDLFNILRDAGLANINLGSSQYRLTSLDECRRFLKWYRDLHPYVLDGYDCNIFALEQYAAACRWMGGDGLLYVWGLEWAAGLDPEYQFPSHGFDFTLDFNRKLYFCDELEVAAPKDDFIEAYEIASNLTIA